MKRRTLSWLTVASGGVVALVVGFVSSGLNDRSAEVLVLAILSLTVLIAALRFPAESYIGAWLFAVFEFPISDFVGGSHGSGSFATVAEDVLVLILVVAAVLRLIQYPSANSGRLRFPRLLTFAFLVFVLCGFMSDLKFDVPILPLSIGFWEDSKIFVLVALAIMTPWTDRAIRRATTIFLGTGIVFVLGGIFEFFDSTKFLSLIHSTSTVSNTGFRGASIQSFFPNPGRLAFFMAICFALSLYLFVRDRKRSMLMCSICFCIVALLSLRVKGMAEVAAIPVAIALLHPNLKKSTRRLTLVVAVVAVVAVVLSFESIITAQVSKYTSSESSIQEPRTLFYSTSLEIANQELPLGVGFGRFGSYPAEKYYSSVYNEYGLSYYYGLSQTKELYLTDTSWPAIIGETGWLGFVGYSLSLISLALWLRKRSRVGTRWTEEWASFSLVVLLVVLIDSLANPTLFDSTAAATFGLFVGFTFNHVRAVPMASSA